MHTMTNINKLQVAALKEYIEASTHEIATRDVVDRIVDVVLNELYIFKDLDNRFAFIPTKTKDCGWVWFKRIWVKTYYPHHYYSNVLKPVEYFYSNIPFVSTEDMWGKNA